MTEQDYIELIRSRWPSNYEAEPTPGAIAICELAVAEFPSSAKLWLMRGDLIQLAGYEGAPPLSDAEQSYRQAIAVSPRCSEAYEALANFFDAVMAKPRKARQYFRKAWLLHRGMA
jgi:Tfp pilus assembly protein PilF